MPKLVACAAGFKEALQRVTGRTHLVKGRASGAGATRHSRFGGIFVRRYNVDDERAVKAVVHSHHVRPELPSLGQAKKKPNQLLVSCQ